MSTKLPIGGQGQLLALALVIALVATLWVGVARPLVAWHAERAEQIAQLRIIARRLANIADELPELRRQTAAHSAEVHPPALTPLGGETDDIAAASLQDLIQRMAQKSGAELTSTETVAAEQIGGYRRIGVRAQVYAEQWSILVHLLQSIAQATQDILIDDMRIQVLPRRGNTEEPLDARFTVLAFRAAVPP